MALVSPGWTSTGREHRASSLWRQDHDGATVDPTAPAPKSEALTRKLWVYARHYSADPFIYQGSTSVAPGDVDYEGHARAFGLQGRECMVLTPDQGLAYTFRLGA